VPLVVATKLIALGRIIARRSPVTPGCQLRSGKELELRHKLFSRIRAEECQPHRRVDHAKSVPQKDHQMSSRHKAFLTGRQPHSSVAIRATHRDDRARQPMRGFVPATG